MKPAAPTRGPVAIALASLVGLVAVLVLPYRFPLKPSVSESYLVGFNNHAALLLFLLAAALLAWWTGGFGLSSPPPSQEPVPPPSRRPLYLSLGFVSCATCALSILTRANIAWGESAYFLDRLQYLAAGGHPYRDFEFAYGPILIYLPLLLARALHLSLRSGYYLAWTLEWILGVWLLWSCVELATPIQALHRRSSIYLLTAATWLAAILAIGSNYTPARFFLAPYLALVFVRRLRAGASAPALTAHALASIALLLLYSPEQGISFCGATIAFVLLFEGPIARREQVLLLSLVIGSTGLCYAADRAGLFLTLRSMANGGYNFPLLPSPALLLILALLAAAAGILFNAIRRRSGGPLEYLILLSVANLPAAFGRSDPGHLLFNTTGAILATWIVLAAYPRKWLWLTRSYVVFILVLPIPLAAFQSAAIVATPIKQRIFGDPRAHPHLVALTTELYARLLGPEQARSKLDRMRQNFLLPGRPWNLPPGKHLFAPFGYPLAPQAPVPPQISEGYFYGLENVTQADGIDNKLRELVADPNRLLLLPSPLDCSYQLNPEQLRLTLETPYIPRARNTVDLYQPLCTYIQQHYSPSPGPLPLPGYQIWQAMH